MLIFFGRNITDKVSSEKTLYCATSNNLCFCTTGKCGNMKIAFFTQMQEFNQSLLDFFNLFKSGLILTLLYDSLNLVISVFSSGLLRGMVQNKEMSRVLHAQCPVCCLLGFLFPQVMLKHWICEVGKQSIVWFFNFSVTLLPKIIVIGSYYVIMSRL